MSATTTTRHNRRDATRATRPDTAQRSSQVRPSRGDRVRARPRPRRPDRPGLDGAPCERRAQSQAASDRLRRAYQGSFLDALGAAFDEIPDATGHAGAARLALAFSRATTRTYAGHGLDARTAQQVRSRVTALLAERLGVTWHARRDDDPLARRGVEPGGVEPGGVDVDPATGH